MQVGKTSVEVKSLWEKNNYKKYLVRLRVEDDKEIIDYVEKYKEEKGTSALFREAMEVKMRVK